MPPIPKSSKIPPTSKMSKLLHLKNILHLENIFYQTKHSPNIDFGAMECGVRLLKSLILNWRFLI